MYSHYTFDQGKIMRILNYRQDVGIESEEHRVRINLGHTEDDYKESNHIPIEGKKSLTTSRAPPLPHHTSFYKKSNHCRLPS